MTDEAEKLIKTYIQMKLYINADAYYLPVFIHSKTTPTSTNICNVCFGYRFGVITVGNKNSPEPQVWTYGHLLDKDWSSGVRIAKEQLTVLDWDWDLNIQDLIARTCA